MSDFNFYPEFVADQVLTADQLNDVFNYLNEQDNMTRQSLIGIGIACGLTLTFNRKRMKIKISQGVGITSNGALINFPGRIYTHCRKYQLPDSLQGLSPYNKYDDGFFQLINEENVKKDDTEIWANDINLSDYVVALFLEKETNELKNCITGDCSDKGRSVNFSIVPLLISKDDMDAIKRETETTDFSRSAQAMEWAKVNLPELNLRRFNVPFKPLRTGNEVINAFKRVTNYQTGILSDIEKAYSQSFTVFKSVLQKKGNPFLNLLERLKSLRKEIHSEHPVFTQYFYDYIRDLIKAYEEFITVGIEVMSTCCPSKSLFSCHLCLGEIEQQPGLQPKKYRNYFRYSPLLNYQKEKVEKLNMLFERMIDLTDGMDLRFLRKQRGNREYGAIKMTPEVLGKRGMSPTAIPYYYNPARVLRHWNYEKSKYGKENTNLSYRSPEYSGGNKAIDQPLLYDYENKNFYRIEGHIGKHFKEVMPELLRQRDNYNLPFNVIALKLGEDAADISVENSHFKDLESQFGLIKKEILCFLGKQICFFGGQQINRAMTILMPEIDLHSPSIKMGSIEETTLYPLEATGYQGKVSYPEAQSTLTNISLVGDYLLQNVKNADIGKEEKKKKEKDIKNGITDVKRFLTDVNNGAYSDKKTIEKAGEKAISHLKSLKIVTNASEKRNKKRKGSKKSDNTISHLDSIIDNVNQVKQNPGLYIMKGTEKTKKRPLATPTVDQKREEMKQVTRNQLYLSGSKILSGIDKIPTININNATLIGKIPVQEKFYRAEFLKSQSCYEPWTEESFSKNVGQYYVYHIIEGKDLPEDFGKDDFPFLEAYVKMIERIEDAVSLIQDQTLESINVEAINKSLNALRDSAKIIKKQVDHFNEKSKSPSLILPDLEKLNKTIYALLNNCNMSGIDALQKERDYRLKALQEKKLFSNFTKEHRGLTHKAGVPKGGTFILVYTDNASFKEIPFGDDVIITYVDKEGKKTKKPIKASGTFIEKENQETVDLDRLISLKIREQLDLYAPEISSPELPEGKVIADFFLPYFCNIHEQGSPTVVQMNIDPGDDKKEKDTKNKKEGQDSPSNDEENKKKDTDPQDVDDEKEKWDIDVVKDWSIPKLEKLSPSKLNQLPPKTLNKLSIPVLETLDTSVIAQLDLPTIEKLNAKTLNQLPTDILEKLSPTKIETLDPGVIGKMGKKTLEKLNPKILERLNSKKLNILSPKVLSNLKEDTQKKLDPKIIKKINPNLFKK